MREAAIFIRERCFPAGRAKLAPFLARHVPAWGIAAGGTLLLAGVGAFATGAAPPWRLYPYWALLMFAGGTAIAWATERFEAGRLAAARAVLVGAAIVLATTIVMTPLVYLLAGIMLGGSWELARLPRLGAQGLLVAGAFYVVHRFAAPRRAREPRRDGALPPSELDIGDRLPARLRGAAIEALQAEDHYLRVHTERGSALILMPLSAALAGVAARRGRQTHRSWWVARDAVVASARRGGRASLTLRSGLRVPVSRTFAPLLRRDGWFLRTGR